MWQTSWRLAVGALLLLWIFHSIFLNEARHAALAKGQDWSGFTRGEQWSLGWRHGPSELWDTLTLIAPVPFALSVLVMGTTLLLGVLRWRRVLAVQGLPLSLGRALEISFVAHFFNSFLLGSTGGDLMKAYYAARETRHKKPEAVMTVFVDRLIGLWAMLLFAGIMMVPNLDLLRDQDRVRTLACVILAMRAGCTLLLTLGFWGGVSRGWSGARAWMKRLPKGDWLERSLDACRQFGRAPWFVFQTLGISMLLNAMCVFQLVLLSWGLDLNLSPWALCLIVPMIICISAVPITPSGLGVRENLFVLMLATPAMNIEATSALSLSLLAYAGSLFWSLVGGGVYLTLKNRHHLRESELTG
jgi:uncharacterized membrane protein YbhN (UPF0104 family)